MLLTYLLLAASCQWKTLALASINLEKAYNQLPRVALWCMLAEELEVPEDIRTSMMPLMLRLG